MKFIQHLALSLLFVQNIQAQSPMVVPPPVQDWIKAKLRDAKPEMENFEDANFFVADSFHLIGYLKGYNVNEKFKTGIIFVANDLNEKDYPTVVKVFEDGRFEAKLPLWYPKMLNMDLKDVWISFYAEPGRTLAAVIDWAAYKANPGSKNEIDFYGPLAGVNKELNQVPRPRPDYKNFLDDVKNKAPHDFKEQLMAAWNANQKLIDTIIAKGNFSKKAAKLLYNQNDLHYGMQLFDYAMNRRYEKQNDTANAVLKLQLPTDYFDFLKRINHFDNGLLVPADFRFLVNRFEFAQPLMASHPVWSSDNLTQAISTDRFRDSIASSVLYTKQGRLYDVIRLNKAKFHLKYNLNTDSSREQYLAQLKNYLSTNSYKKEADNILKDILDKELQRGKEIPDTYAGRLFKEIIAPYKGKLVFIDFWATTCGPCVGGIQQMKPIREQYKDSSDFVFVFITSEDESPKTDYEKFISEQGMVHSKYMNIDDYRYLRELFRINGIPRYALISADGKILDDNFSMDSFQYELGKLLPKYR